MLKATNLSFAIGSKTLLSETSVGFPPGQFHVVMGANGAGKTTLLKLLAGDLQPSSGKIFLFDKELGTFSKKALAMQRAVLSQHYHISFPILVKEIVLMGRYPYYQNNPATADLHICENALHRLDLNRFKERNYGTLSGGEAQKVQMSRVLAQIGEEELSGKILFLDEPVSHLDIKYQQQLLGVAKTFCKSGVTVVAVLHDINLALSFADRLLLMKSGRIAYDLEAPADLTPYQIRDIFYVEAKILQLENRGPLVVF